MIDYWITTHWPTPKDAPFMSRHVYIKGEHAHRPEPGDVIFIREAQYAKDKDKKLVRTIDLHHHDQVTPGFAIYKGTGGIIGLATVDGLLRKQQPDDIVFDYFGDLPEWSVIPCRDFQPASLSLKELRALLGVQGTRHLNLWRMPKDNRALKLLKTLRR